MAHDFSSSSSVVAPGFADIVIAATARHYGMTILTRNRKPFDHLDVTVLDPLE